MSLLQTGQIQSTWIGLPFLGCSMSGIQPPDVLSPGKVDAPELWPASPPCSDACSDTSNFYHSTIINYTRLYKTLYLKEFYMVRFHPTDMGLFPELVRQTDTFSTSPSSSIAVKTVRTLPSERSSLLQSSLILCGSSFKAFLNSIMIL